MTLIEGAQLLGNFGEFIGAITVVATLFYLAVQVRHGNEQTALNTRAQNLAAYQQLCERISEFNLITIQNPELRAVRKQVEAGEELSSDEASILSAFLFLVYRNGDLAYLQYEQGIIDESRLRSGLGLLSIYLHFPFVQAHWKRAQEGFVDSYRDYIDQLITQINLGETPMVSGTRQ